MMNLRVFINVLVLMLFPVFLASQGQPYPSLSIPPADTLPSSLDGKHPGFRSHHYPRGGFNPLSRTANHPFRFGSSPTTILDSSSTPSFKQVGHWGWGDCYAVDARGNYAYIGNGGTFQVLDISNASAPVIVGETYVNDIITDIHLRGSLAYVTNGSGFLTVDISNPLAPHELGYIFLGWWSMKFAAADSFAYVGRSDDYLFVIDVSNPMAPFLRSWVQPFRGFYPVIAVSKLHVFMSDEDIGAVFVIDVSKPDTPSVDTAMGLGGWGVDCLFFSDTLLFAGVAELDSTVSIHVVDVATPVAPYELGKVVVSSIGSNGMNTIDAGTVSGTYAYVATGDSGVYSIDISQPISPTISSSLKHQSFQLQGVNSTAFSGKTVFAACYSGVWIVDAGNPLHLDEKSFFPTGGFAGRVTLRGDYAFVASFESGVWILDISNGMMPAPVANINVGSWSEDVLLDGNYLYFVNAPVFPNDTAQGLWIADISDIRHPAIVSHHPGIVQMAMSGINNHIAKSGSLVFMTQAEGWVEGPGMEIIDVGNPAHVESVGVFVPNDNPCAIAVRDSIVYLGTEFGGLKIINASNPASPIQISTMFPYTDGLAVHDTLLYALADSFYAANIKDPGHPSILGHMPRTGGGLSPGIDLECSMNGHVYSAAYSYVHAFDVSVPGSPSEVGECFLPEASGVGIKGNTLFSGSGRYGVYVVLFDTLSLTFMKVQAGWNIVSVPCKSSDVAPSVLFPGATSGAFRYDNGYKLSDSLIPGTGYWMKFASPESLAMDGSPLSVDTVPVKEGWNLIGSISVPVRVGSITSDPPGLVTSQVFGHGHGYFTVDTMVQGRGYWVKVSQSGKLILSSSPGIRVGTITIVPTKELPPAPPDGEISNLPSQIPNHFGLEQNYPNPFNPAAIIRYQIPKESFVHLSVYNVLGQEVRTLVNELEQPGEKIVQFEAASLPSGIYFYRITAGTFTDVKKMLLLK